VNVEHQGERERNGRVAIVTDSTAYLPKTLIDGVEAHTVSLYVGWEGDLRREDEYASLDDFYRRLRESPQLPRTSQPSIGDFLAVYRPLVRAGRDVVSLHIAEGLSGTCQSAREAASILANEQHSGRVSVHDAETGAGGLGSLVVVAGRMAADGESADAILAGVRAARASLDIWFCLDTLEYLQKGGRIGAAQAAIGTALRIKPILTFGTEIEPVGRVRTHRRAIDHMVGCLKALRERGAREWIVQHAQSPQDAGRLVDAGTELFGHGPLFCTEVGPVLGAHLGVGVLVGGFGGVGQAVEGGR
jgi:DegV family protein with EDD domain